MHNPKPAHAVDPLGRHFAPGAYSLTERERDIAVLVINSEWRSDYPTAAHERRDKEVGLAPEAVEAIIADRPASFTDPREQVSQPTRPVCRADPGLSLIQESIGSSQRRPSADHRWQVLGR